MKAILHAWAIGGTLLAGLAACSGPAAPVTSTATVNDEARRAILSVTSDFVSSRIREFSDDGFEGRGTATAGDVKARAWLVSQLKEMGYAPGGTEGSWSSRSTWSASRRSCRRS